MINIVLASDSNYFDYMMVSVISLLENTTSNTSIKCLYTSEIKDREKKIEEVINQKFPLTNFKFIEFEVSKIPKFKTKGYITLSAYIRLFIADLFPEMEKIIYLDSDVMVREDISILWNYFDNVENTISAVWDPFSDEFEIYGLTKCDKTFNSGVILLNLKQYRENKDIQKLTNFIVEKGEKSKYHDQAALNYVYATNWKELPLEWNVMNEYYLKSHKKIGISKEKLTSIRKKPAIVHFASPAKPWKFRSAHPYKKEYVNYLLKINPEFKTEEFSIVNILKKTREYTKVLFHNISF